MFCDFWSEFINYNKFQKPESIRFSMKCINVKRVSEITGITAKTLYEWTKEGKIPYFRIEKLIRFDEEEIIAWMKSKAAATSEKNVDKVLRSIYSQTKGRPSRLGKEGEQ